MRAIDPDSIARSTGLGTNASRDGRYRGIKLDLAAAPDPGVHVQYRKGYYAPQQ